jgi:hypothetical protein
MNKKTLIKVVENIEYFEGYNSPQEIYLNLGTYSDFQSILKVMNGKDVMLFCFLTYERRFLVDLSKLYDFIISNYSEFTIGEILNHNPNKECYQCDGGGNVGCTQCYGDGEVDCSECGGDGKMECNVCNGDGVDSDGDTCYDCEGDGEVKCSNCYGRGNETCSDCGGDGELECNICDGEGEIKAVNETLVKMTRYLSYDINFTKKFENMEADEVISPEFYNRLMNRQKFLVLHDFDYLYEDWEYPNYKKMEDGDVFLLHEKSQPELINSFGKISIKQF